MAKVVVIGDIHGRDTWKKIIDANKDASKFIFIGDYFDSFNIPYKNQIKNFSDILKFKTKMGKKVVLLIGNHDYHYMFKELERYSGFSPENADYIQDVTLKAYIEGLMEMSHIHGKYLFTHAGVTKTWCDANYIDYQKKSRNSISKQINILFSAEPEAFMFTPSTGLDNYGDSITQPPIWVRPRALVSDIIPNYTQVVGHTYMKEITKDGDAIFIDSLSSGNYLIIENGKVWSQKIK